MKIVLTGGPSAGKTSITDILFRSHWDKIAIVPEGASILFRGGFPRAHSDEHMKCQQRAIYHLQCELENIMALDSKHRSLICDRGTLDGLAYWPGSEQEFYSSVRSTPALELARYDWVIHLDTAQPVDYQVTSIRTETENEARTVNEKVRHAWAQHPNRLIVNSSAEFLHKVDATLGILSLIFAGRTSEQIRRQLAPKGVK